MRDTLMRRPLGAGIHRLVLLAIIAVLHADKGFAFGGDRACARGSAQGEGEW